MSTTSKQSLGVALMVFAMLAIPISDGYIKLLSSYYPVLLLNWFRFLIGGIIFVPTALWMLKQHQLRSSQVAALSGRTVLHVLAISLYFLAIAEIPIADALGAYFIAPIVGIVLAAGLLGERLSRTPSAAVMIGFIGAITIVQPGATMEIEVLYAVAAGIVFGCFLVLTRTTAQEIPPLITIGFQCGLGSLLLLPVAFIFWIPVRWSDGLLLCAISCVWAVAHLAAIYAFKYATTNVLAPIVYFEMAGGAAVGYILFGDMPTGLTLVGIAMVIYAGILVQKSLSDNTHTPRPTVSK